MTERYIVLSSDAQPDKRYYEEFTVFSEYDKAETAAKKMASKKQTDYIIMKDFATAKAVVPAIEVVKH